MPQSGHGEQHYHMEFGGAEIPVANAVAYGTNAGGCAYFMGPFRVVGDLVETDTGLVGLDTVGGALRVSGNNENGKGVAIGTAVCWSPSLNGTLIAECRVQMAALTTRSIFFGFSDILADDAAEPVTSTGTAHTLVHSDLCGFVFDSQLSNADEWHCVFNGGSTTGETVSTNVESGVTAVLGEWDILRLEIDTNGTARYYINENIVQTTVNAVSTTVLQAFYFGAFGTASAVADADLQYLCLRASRDWTR